MLKTFRVLGTTVCLLAVVTVASADVVFNLTKPLNGDVPVGGTPWLRATFQTESVGQVKLTMENLLSTAQFVRYWNFNLEPYASVTYSHVSGAAPTAFNQGHDNQQGSSSIQGGKFDLSFEFATSNSGRFKGGMTAVVRLFATGLTETHFNAQSTNDGKGHMGYQSAAKIQGIPGANSGSIATVPEPATLGALAIGALALLRKRN